MPKRADILRSYRELLYLIKRLPTDRRATALQEAREKLQAGKAEANELAASDLHKQLVSRIGFLRLSTPRRPGDRYAKSASFVFREGEVREGPSDGETRSTESKLTLEDARQQHHKLMKRQFFGREPPRVRPPF